MKNRVQHYLECAKVCAVLELGNKKSVRANNRAVDTMYRLVREANTAGPEAVAELFGLLDDSQASPWIAHQLLEICKVPDEIERRCLSIIEELAKTSLGDQWWLRDYHAKKRNA